MRNVLKELLPGSLQTFLRSALERYRRSRLVLIRAALADAGRYWRHSQLGKRLEQFPKDAAQADLLRKMHSIEKGLALPSPEPGFGKEKIRVLIDAAEAYQSRFGKDWHYGTVIGVLQEYRAFQSRFQIVNPDVEGFLNRADAAEPGGTIVLDTADGNGAGHLDFAAFARSRHSVRNFADRPVDEATILEAIDTARFAPSVCNRSSGRVYYSFDRKDITEALKVQQGATGFMATIPCLMVVVSDRRAFYSVGERNQCFVDGGLFAMSLVYALHGMGLGTCMLNWSKTPKVDQDLRRRFRIDDEHEIISLVAVGHRPDNVRVARSPRADAASFHRKLQARA